MTDCTVRVRLTPRSDRDEVLGWQDGVLRVRVHAAPVDGRANEALCRLLAEQLDVPRTAVELLRGASSRMKTLRITGISREEAEARLVAPGS
jgi:uncharacterized protein (TIGR00251 family)